MKSKSIAIIPARSGSKRLPGKNIRKFFGQPIIKYAIVAALKSNCFDEVMVSTDDPKIAKVALSAGASVPFLRSNKNSSGNATVVNALLEVLAQYEKQGQQFNYICCLFPTAPFITSAVLKNAYQILKTKKVDAVIPVVKYSHPIQRALRVKDNLLKMINQENMFKMTQNFEKTYYDVGQFYFLKTDKFLKFKQLFLPKTVPIIISEEDVSDIDTPEDWKQAERKYLLKKKLLLQAR